jgi:hypothetical protein
MFFPFPVGLALGRTLLEKEAYDETVRAEIDYHGTTEVVKSSLKRHYIKALTGPGYVWAFPFPKIVGAWFEKSWEKACKEFRKK